MTATSGVTPERIREFLQPWADAWELFTAQRIQGDAWPWVELCMRTRDEMKAARGLPSEALPVPDKPHLRIITWAWYACRLLDIDKARQLMVTWMGCGLTVHAAQFTPSAREAYQNMKMSDTAEKLDKYMLYILKHQPMDLILPWVEQRGHPPEAWVGIVAAEFDLSMTPKQEPRADQPPSYGSDAYHLAKTLTNTYRTESGPEGVENIWLYPFFDPTERLIEGIPAGPAGPNKWRGGTRTGANHDEAFFQQSLGDNLNSALKSVGDFGYHRLWSTASLGEDGDAYPLEVIKKHDHQPDEFGGWNGTPVKRPEDMPEGIEIWRTQFGYTHLRIHHYSDPDKRGEDWVRRNVYETGDVRKNLREVLIQYNAPSGKPFYPSFRYNVQKLQKRPRDTEGALLVLGMDGGRRPATVVLLVYPSGRVVAIRELVTPLGVSTNVTAHATALRRVLSADPLTRDWQREHIVVLDPSMFDTRGETDDRTSADILQEMGFFVTRGAMSADVRYEAVTNLCLRSIPDDNLPALLVDQGACPTLFEALSGACTVRKGAERTGRNDKEKNHFSHVTEALEYPATYVDGTPVSGAGEDALPQHHTKRR